MCPPTEIRTAGQAIAELGRRMARLILTTDQLDLYNQSPLRVFLTGPPGTGKTLMLVLMGLKWLREQKDVHVLSTRPGSLAASTQIQLQLENTMSEDQATFAGHGNVVLKHYDLYHREWDVGRAVRDLSAASQAGGRLYILMDEAAVGDE